MAADTLPADVKAAFGVALVLALGATLLDNGGAAWAAAAVAVPLLAYAMARAPLRSSLLTLMFFAFTLENPQEMPAAGAWQSPLFMLGAMMLTHLNKPTGVEFLSFSATDLCLAYLGLVLFARKFSGSRTDQVGGYPTPKPLVQLAQLSLAGTALVWLIGIVLRGGDSSMAVWQVNRVVVLPLMFLLFQAGLRGPRDHVAIAKVVLWAAVIRALLATYVKATIDMPIDPSTGDKFPLPYATSHHDSMLFAFAAVILLAMVLQRVGGNTTKLALVILPILVSGMLANNRRMVWVQIILVFVVIFFATPMNPVKRRVTRLLKIAAPVLLLYVIVGWNSGNGIFKPVKTIRSAVDSSADASTQWRDIENFDLLVTIREYPLFGTGFGHGFIEAQPFPEVDYVLERFAPHNSLVGMWAYCGYVGYTMMTLLWVAGIFFSIRAYHAADNPRDKAAALVSFGAIPIYYLQCYGDMGLGSWTGLFMVTPALAAGGKLAVATGAWPAALPRAQAMGAAAPTRPTRPSRPSPA